MNVEKKSINILFVEDDINLGFVVKDNLEAQGFNVTHATDGEQGFELFNKQSFDICVFDIMLPKKDGFSLAKDIRKSNKQVPILFLTSRSMKEDKLNGFEIGGDDYITKPFLIEELSMRIRVFLKRHNQVKAVQDAYQIGESRFDYANLILKDSKNERRLTQKEADVLFTLCSSSENVVRREDILMKVWGDDDYFMGRSLDVFISKLRGYFKHDSSVEIRTVHGIGFCLIQNR